MKMMFEIKKHSLLGIISLILAIIVIIIITIEFVINVIGPVIWPVIPPEDFWYILIIIFDVGNTFFVLLFLTIITTIVGIIAQMVKKDSFGKIAILIGILCFIFNWFLLFFVLSKLDF